MKKEKKKAWEWFSKYIRLRDCLKSTGTSTSGKCVTCGRVKDFKELQAGHFLPGRHPSVLFDERNVHAQCYHCNLGLKGNWVPYLDYMLKEYGQKVIDELKAKDKIPSQMKAYQYTELAEKYKIKFKERGGE